MGILVLNSVNDEARQFLGQFLEQPALRNLVKRNGSDCFRSDAVDFYPLEQLLKLFEKQSEEITSLKKGGAITSLEKELEQTKKELATANKERQFQSTIGGFKEMQDRLRETEEKLQETNTELAQMRANRTAFLKVLNEWLDKL